MCTGGIFSQKIMFSHKNGIFCKRELWTSLAAAALSSCCCVKTVYGIWIYTSVFITVFCHVDHETLGVMAECRNQNFIFTLYMIILLAFEKRDVKRIPMFYSYSSPFFLLFYSSVHLGPSWSADAGCWYVVLLVLLPTMLFCLPTIYQNREERRQNKV